MTLFWKFLLFLKKIKIFDWPTAMANLKSALNSIIWYYRTNWFLYMQTRQMFVLLIFKSETRYFSV